MALCLLLAFCAVGAPAVARTLSAPAIAAKAKHHRHHKHKHPAAAPDSCAVTHTHVLASDAQAQVYLMQRNTGQLEVFACAESAKRSYILGPFPECAPSGACLGVETFALNGTVAAFGSITIAEPSSPSEEVQRRFLVQVRDLRTNRTLRLAPTGVPSTPHPGLTGIGRVRAIVVMSDGAVAWIAQDETGEAPGSYEVVADDASGPRVLAGGPGIDPTSLMLVGSTVHWSRAGQSASATLD